MDFELDAIPTIEGAGRLGRQSQVDAGLAEAYRSYEVGGASSLASMLGFAGADALQRLRTAVSADARAAIRFSDIQRYGAAGPSYTTHGDCTIFQGYGGTCQEACFGFEPQHMDPFYCGTCAEQAADPINNPSFNWHFVGSRGSFQYKDMEYNACNGKDAWKWKVNGACGNCSQSSIFRCHDGYKKYPDEDYWTPTICQGIVTCDDELKTC